MQEGSACFGQGKAWITQLCVRRRRQLPAPGRRALQTAGTRESRACAVQGRWTGNAGRRRRTRRTRLPHGRRACSQSAGMHVVTAHSSRASTRRRSRSCTRSCPTTSSITSAAISPTLASSSGDISTEPASRTSSVTKPFTSASSRPHLPRGACRRAHSTVNDALVHVTSTR